MTTATPTAAVRRPRATKKEVTVYVRHKSDCPFAANAQSRKCRCAKYLSVQEDGKRTRISAATRSWEKAEQKAQEMRDRWEPSAEPKPPSEAGEITIAYSLERWVESNKVKNPGTLATYKTLVGHVEHWAGTRGRMRSGSRGGARRSSAPSSASDAPLVRLSQLNPDLLDEWVSSWSERAEDPRNRLGPTTAGRRLEKVKDWLGYCVTMGWIAVNPALGIKPIKPGDNETMPLLDGRYEMVFEATYRYDESMRPDDRMGEYLRAILETQVWTGLRIGDVLLLARGAFKGNTLSIRAKKTGQKMSLQVPDHVIDRLDALKPLPHAGPHYYFWSGTSLYKSLTTQWHHKLSRLNDFISMTDYEGRPLRFHPHQLRDTFAVRHLLNGMSIGDLSKLLGHKSVKVTERYYSPWVPARQARLDELAKESQSRLGAVFSR